MKLDKNKTALYTLCGLIAMITIQAVIRNIGIDNMPVQVIIAFFTIVCFLFVALQYKNRTKGFGTKYNMTVAILLVIACFFPTLMITIYKYYPNINNNYMVFLTILTLVSFFTLSLYVVIYRIIYEYKHR